MNVQSKALNEAKRAFPRLCLRCRFDGKLKPWQKYSIEFLMGGIGYGLLEVIWRGRTHWSMIAAGGISFVAVLYINKKMKEHSIFLRASLGAVFITAVEFLIGLIVNEVFHMNVWNYDKLPGNVMGQICPLYSAIWFGICFLICISVRKKENS